MAFSSSFFSSVLVQCLCHLRNACASQWAECILCCSLVSFFFLLPCLVSLGTKELLFSSLWTGCLLCCALLWSLCLCVSLCEQYTARPRTSPAIPAEPCGVHIWDWRGTVGPYTPFEGLTGISDLFWTLLYCIITECIVCCVVYGV